ncbi:MAG: hypothetical protein KDD69_10075, partial [Bdellovibrionales bacterium]|nr:hypothetical protein [Bdellovibrionales bacterium]
RFRVTSRRLSVSRPTPRTPTRFTTTQTISATALLVAPTSIKRMKSTRSELPLRADYRLHFQQQHNRRPNHVAL